MALIHVFNGLNEKTTYTYCGKLRDNIPGVDWNKAIILNGGKRITADYEVGDSDIIFVRKLPGAASTIAVVSLAVAITAVVAGGIAIGVSIYKNREAMSKMEDAERKAKAGAETAGKLPFIKGARNQPATGRSFPYIMGKTLMTPYRLCPAHYTIDGYRGSEQYYNVVLEIGYNNLVLEKIKMGETVIKDFGEPTEPQDGTYDFDTGTYYDVRNIIEIKQTGAFTHDDFNKKIICTELNSEIPHKHAVSDAEENAKIEAEWKAGVVQELPTHAQSVELIAIFDGLQKYDDGWREQTIELSPQWTNVDNPTEEDWNDFDYGFDQDGTNSNTFTYNTKQQMRFSARQDFSAAQAYGKNIKVRVRRLTPVAADSAKDSVYLLAVQTTCYDAKKSSAEELVTADVLEPRERDGCCRIGLRIAANVNTNGQLDAISVIVKGCARTWNGTTWSETKTPTSNIAAWALEVLTSPHHKPSQYDDAELDLNTFGAWYEYCDTMGFNADGVIVKNTKKKAILDTLCQNSNAALVYNPMTGLMEVALDNGRDYSVALLNSDNIMSISTVKKFERKADGKKVKYVNGAADYDVDSVIFMRDGGEYDPANDTLTETTLEYVTTYEHAFKIAWRQMAEELAQPRIVTIKAGRESAYYPLFSRVEVQHRTLQRNTNAVIKTLTWQNHALKTITLDGYVTFPQNTACGVIISCISENGRGLVALKVNGTGKTDTLEVLTSLSDSADIVPIPGNSLSFGELDENGEFTTVTTQMKITNAEETDDGYTLTLVDYNPAVYQYGTLPAYKSNLTAIPDGSTKTIEEQRNYMTEGEVQASNSGAVQAAVDTVIKGTRFTNVYKVRPVESTLEEIIARLDDDARNASASISISTDEILLQVADVQRGLRGLIDIQAGAVTALVEGGGATGQMSLTLNLPVMIDATKRAQLVQGSTEAKVAAVYALVDGTDYYGIRPDASNAAIKALWDDAIREGLIASQIDLSATQIKVSAENVYIDSDVIVNESNKIKAALIDVENLLATDITVKDKGVIHSSNYNGTINEDTGVISGGSAGWAIDHAGNAVFNNATLKSATVEGNITALTGHFFAGIGEIEEVENGDEIKGEYLTQLVVLCGKDIEPLIPFPGYKAKINVIFGAYLICGTVHTHRVSGVTSETGDTQLIKLYENTSYINLAVTRKQSSSSFATKNYTSIDVNLTQTAIDNYECCMITQSFNTPE